MKEPTQANQENKGIRIAAGIVAILAAGAMGYWLVAGRTINFSITAWQGLQNWFRFGVFQMCSVSFILSRAVLISAMVIFVIGAFRYKKRKERNPLLGVSAVLSAVGSLLIILDPLVLFQRRISSFRIMPLDPWGWTWGYSRVVAERAILVSSAVLIAIIFIIIALRYFGVIKFGIKALPIIVAVITIGLFLWMMALEGFFINSVSSPLWVEALFSRLYIVPFLLLVLFCSPKKEEKLCP